MPATPTQNDIPDDVCQRLEACAAARVMTLTAHRI